MAISLSDDVIGLVDGRNFAHLATIMSDGSPTVLQSGSVARTII